MIFRRYGTSYHSVQPDFDSKALTEVTFRRDRRVTIATEEFEARYEKLRSHELQATAEGYVHDEVEQVALDELEAELSEVLAGLGEGDVLVVESEGVDQAKTRAVQKNVILQGENRLHFTVRIDPPLRVGVYRERG